MISVAHATLDEAWQVDLSGENVVLLQRALLCSSKAWVGKVDGKTACIWGLVPASLLSDTAYLWLLTTELVEDHQFLFVRHSQIEIRRMLEVYKTICGHCDVRNTRSVRWIKWLGGKFDTSRGPVATFTIGRD